MKEDAIGLWDGALPEVLPDLEIFHRFFEAIVQQCVDAGLVWGKELYFDATKV
jgi:hypothetical protein